MARKTPAREAFASRVKKELRADLEARHAKGEFPDVTFLEDKPLPAGRIQPRPEAPAVERLRQQYRDALEDVARAGRQKKYAREHLDKAHKDVLLSRSNMHLFEDPAQRASAEEVVKCLLKLRDIDERHKAARTDLKAAQKAYLNHVDEE